MSSFFYGAAAHPAQPVNPHPHTNHHGTRNRRTPRLGQKQQQQQQQMRSTRTQKEVMEAAAFNFFLRDFEAAKSFELEDDEVFCPFHLLTEDDLQSIHSSGSDRSSLSSGSPESSPLQHQLQPTPSLVLPSSTHHLNTHPAYQHTSQHTSQPKLHQPMAQRARNPIPIVDPSTRAVASPPPSVSPARQMQQQHLNRPRW